MRDRRLYLRTALDRFAKLNCSAAKEAVLRTFSGHNHFLAECKINQVFNPLQGVCVYVCVMYYTVQQYHRRVVFDTVQKHLKCSTCWMSYTQADFMDLTTRITDAEHTLRPLPSTSLPFPPWISTARDQRGLLAHVRSNRQQEQRELPASPQALYRAVLWLRVHILPDRVYHVLRTLF